MLCRNVDGRVVITGGKVTREHDVPVENGTHRVGDRLGLVISLDQHRVETGDAAAATEAPGALEQPGEQREDRRRVSLGGGRLAGGQTNLPLRHGEARHRVHHQQHLTSLVAKVLGDGRGRVGGTEPEQRRAVRGRHHDDRSPKPLVAEVVLEERRGPRDPVRRPGR